MRSLINDEKAIERMPFKLLIVAIVLIIAIPTVYSGMEYYDTRRTLEDIQGEVRFIGEKVEHVFIHGTGNSESIEVNFKDGIFEKIEYVILCGDPGYMIRWNTLDHSGRYLIPKKIPLFNRNGSIKLSGGTYRIRFTCKFGNPSNSFKQKNQYIELEIME